MKIKFELYLEDGPSGISFFLDPDKTPLAEHKPYGPKVYSAVQRRTACLNFLTNSQREKVIGHTVYAGYISKLVSRCGTIIIDLTSEYRTKDKPK